MVSTFGQAQEKALTQSDRRISDLEKEITNLRAQVGKLSESLREVQNFAARVRIDFEEFKEEYNEYKDVQLDLAEPRTYQRLDSLNGTGSFLISVEDAVPYLDGYKVHLEIGNPSAARYTGFRLKMKWTKHFPKNADLAFYGEWRKTIKEKEVSFTETLMPGMWNKIEIILSPASVDELGYFHVSLETSAIQLPSQP
jgi:vacuolar-type H+-ATPase subunit I/STV1